MADRWQWLLSLAMGTRFWSPQAICTTAQERGLGSPAPLPASASSPVDGVETEWTSEGPQGRAAGGAVTAVVSGSLSFFKDQEPQGKTLRGCCKSGSGSHPPCFLSRLPQLSAQPGLECLGCLVLLHQWLRILSGTGTALFLCRSRVGILARPGGKEAPSDCPAVSGGVSEKVVPGRGRGCRSLEGTA